MDTTTGSPEPPTPTEQGGPGAPGATEKPTGRQTTTDDFFDALRRVGITRSDDRWIGGVAAGVADRFRIDPLLVRGVLFASFFLAGVGLVLYGFAWALLPERRDGRIHAQEMLRGNFDVAMLGAIAMMVVGAAWRGGWWSWWDSMGLGWLTGVFWVAAIVVVAYLAVPALREQAAARRTAQQDAPWGTPDAAAPVDPSGSPAGPTTAPAAGSPGSTTWPTADATVTDDPGTANPRGWAHQGPSHQDGGARQRAPRPPRPPRAPRRRGPGSTTVGIVLGLSLLLGAVLLVAERQDVLDWPVLLTWLAGSVVLAGAGIVVSGLRGRTSGALGTLAILALVVAVPVAGWNDQRTGVFDLDARAVSEGTHRIMDPDVAEQGFAVRWGDSTIDLSDLDLSGASGEVPVLVPVDLGAGDLTIVVPDGVPMRAEIQVLAGTALWQVDGADVEDGGISTEPRTFTNAEVDAGEDPLLVLDVEVGAGQVTIEEN